MNRGRRKGRHLKTEKGKDTTAGTFRIPFAGMVIACRVDLYCVEGWIAILGMYPPDPSHTACRDHFAASSKPINVHPNTLSIHVSSFPVRWLFQGSRSSTAFSVPLIDEPSSAESDWPRLQDLPPRHFLLNTKPFISTVRCFLFFPLLYPGPFLFIFLPDQLPTLGLMENPTFFLNQVIRKP